METAACLQNEKPILPSASGGGTCGGEAKLIEGSKRVLWRLLILLSPLILALPVIQPLLQNQLTVGYDNVLHLWRGFEADQMLSHGILYTRWYPHMAFGIGYPMLLFNPPISPLLAALLHRAGLGWPAAVNGVFALGILLSGWTAWLLVREDWGDGPALAAAAAIVTIPFHAYVTFHRASMSEALAWSYPALVLWGLRRWQGRKDRLGLLAASGGTAAMLLTHDAFSYLFLPLPCLLVLALAIAHQPPQSRRSRWDILNWAVLWRGVLALALGLGLAAFFWMPSVLERGYVQFERVLEYDYTASFVPLDYLLEPPRTADTALINPWLPKGMGLLPVLAALPALGAILQGNRERRFWLGTLLLATVGYLWVASPAARWFWRLVPPLAYLHFPWRFFSPASVGVATLAGAGTGWLARKWRPAAPLVILALVLGALGWLYPRHMDMAWPTTLSGMVSYEHATNWLGGTAFGELLPRWVEHKPDANPLEADLHAGEEPVRLRPEDLPEGATILEADYGPNRARLVIDSPVAFRARYWTFYYPGWWVEIDGLRTLVTPSEPDGLITFDVPAGRHTITVRFGETPLRLAMDVISVLSLVALGVVVMRAGISVSKGFPPSIPRGEDRPSPLRRNVPRRSRAGELEGGSRSATRKQPQWALFALVLLLPLIKVLVIDRVNTPLRQDNLEGDHLRNVEVARDVTFDGQFHLLGYDALPVVHPADQPIDVWLYWRDSVPGGPDYRVGLALKDADGLRWSDPAQYPPRWHRKPPPASEWPPDKYAMTAFEVQPLPGAPPGVYTVTVSVFDTATSVTYPARDEQAGKHAQGVSTEVVLGQVQLTAPEETAETLDARYTADASWGPLRLGGYNLDREEAMPGDPMLVTLFWQAEAEPEVDYVAVLHLLDEEGTPAASFALSPVREDFPTSQWQAGELWRGQHLLRLPPELESGMYRWTLYACPESELPPPSVPPEGGEEMQTLRINAPERRWTAPPLDMAVDARLGEAATLLGARMTPAPDGVPLSPGETLSMTLVWRAESETPISYRVFVHLLGPDGALMAQADGVPADWARPTTGWLLGEIILDPRMLVLPENATPDTYRLQAGMYTLEAGRLHTPDGADAVLLAEITVQTEPKE